MVLVPLFDLKLLHEFAAGGAGTSNRRHESGKERIMHDYGGWMWFLIDVGLVAILAAALIYGIGMWRRRPRNNTTQEIRDEATDRLYHKQQ
jgi:hypothetical protein